MNKQLDFIQVFVSVSDGFAENACMDSSCVIFFFICIGSNFSTEDYLHIDIHTRKLQQNIFVLIQHLAHS